MNAQSFNNNQKTDPQNNQAVSVMQGGPTSGAPAQVVPPQQDPNSVPQFDILDGPNVSSSA